MTVREQVAIAVDVGGSSVKCALIDPAGELWHTERHPTGRERGAEAVVQTIVAIATDLVAKARAQDLEPVACGVVVPGVVDEATGVLEWSANLGLNEVPLRDTVAQRVGLRTALGHDVRAGALAEARLGAGRTARRMLFVAIGTGIAGGYAVDGLIDPGAHGASGEIGHMTVRTGPEAAPCGCGARGCLEAHASAAAVAKAYGADGADAAQVVRLAQAGDSRAIAVWQDTVAALADGLLTGIALYDPKLIVLGGGLAEAGAFLIDPLGKALAQRRTFHRLPDLALAELGDQAGCHGAALLAFDLLGEHG